MEGVEQEREGKKGVAKNLSGRQHAQRREVNALRYQYFQMVFFLLGVLNIPLGLKQPSQSHSGFVTQLSVTRTLP